MEIIKITLIGLAGVITAIMMKTCKNEYAHYIAIAASVVIFAYIVVKMNVIIDTVTSITDKINIEKKYVGMLLKMCGIAYVSEFGASVCKDSGYTSIASQVEMFAKIAILVVSLPIVKSLIETIYSL